MPPHLSLAMIVKNESGHLPECLAQAAAWADELCVIDTGSTDDTVTLAERAGARVAHFPWCDDFAAARNASLALCTGDWIFVLDADERIAPEDHAALRALTRGPRDTAYRVTTRNYTHNTATSEFVPCAEGDPHARGFAGWFPSTKVRLFPNGLGAHFEGAVHELINPSLERAGLRIDTAAFPVHHYGLAKAPETLQEKYALYLRLGQAKLAADPTNPKAHAELGNQYIDLGDYARAAQSYRDALRFAPNDAGLLKDLGSALHLLGRGAEAEKALRLATTLDPTLTEAWRNLGVVLAHRNAWPEAHAALTRALQLAPHNPELHRYLEIVTAQLNG